MKKAILLTDNHEKALAVFPDAIRQALSGRFEFLGEYTKKSLSESGRSDAGIVFSTWGMPHYTEEEIKSTFPHLEAVFYAAGSVQGFAREFLSCGIKVFSAWGANAVPVAEYAAAQIVLANKGFFGSSFRAKKDRGEAARHFGLFEGNYGAKVGIIGAGMIGRMVIERLRAYKLDVLVFDPFLPEEYIKAHAIRMATLEEIFSECQVISNHLANNDATAGMLCGKYFDRMRENAVFINTGRGRQVVEEDLVKALRDCPDRCAVLDVTFPEPPEKGHPFYSMDNVILTPHIAGSAGQEVVRMAEYMIDEYDRYEKGEPNLYEVSLGMLERMA